MRNDPEELPELFDAVKRTAEILRGAEVPFALCGGLAVFARGGTQSDHDVDLPIREQDVDRALDALDEAGFETQRPPEDWLVKAFHGHAHRGCERGVTPGGVRVRNVAHPVIRQAFSVFHLGAA